MTTVILSMIAGFVAIMLEVVIPGGVLGVTGLVLLVVAVYASWPLGGAAFFVALMVAVIGAPVSFLLGMALLPHSSLGRILTLRKESRVEDGYTSSEPGLDELVGQTGETITKLRPAGMAKFGDQRVDVVSRGFVIRPGTRVRVTEVEGNRVVVAPGEEQEKTG